MTAPVDKILNLLTEQGALVAFELLVIIVLVYALRVLYFRNIKQGDDQARAFTDSTIAINNNTAALNALTKQIERMNNAKGN